MTTIARLFRRYTSSYWIPATLFIVAAGAFTLVAVYWPSPLPLLAALGITSVALLGIVVAGAINIGARRWGKGAANLVVFPLGGLLMAYGLGSLFFAFAFGPSEDGFADELTVPADIVVADPVAPPEAGPDADADPFASTILASVASPGTGGPTVNANLPSLVQLQSKHPDLLKRYLAASPAWRVFRERGHTFATRRWMRRYSLHGYYTNDDLEQWPDPNAPQFQTRLTVGLTGQPWARMDANVTRLTAGQPAQAKLSPGNQMLESRCIISAGQVAVEIFEQSQFPQRRITNASLAALEAELAPLAADPTWETARRNLPPDSVRRGPASLELHDDMQPGIYQSELWINPGEGGAIYLKAFEVTKGTPLSVARLAVRSGEYVGWSDDPAEQFFSNTLFTIYEGDWGKPYAARFEVWFTPDSGQPERKLLEKTFRIEGWQR